MTEEPEHSEGAAICKVDKGLGGLPTYAVITYECVSHLAYVQKIVIVVTVMALSGLLQSLSLLNLVQKLILQYSDS
jgi:hypothetical protein